MGEAEHAADGSFRPSYVQNADNDLPDLADISDKTYEDEHEFGVSFETRGYVLSTAIYRGSSCKDIVSMECARKEMITKKKR